MKNNQIDKRLLELGITLPEGSKPAANYANAVRTGNLLFLSGKSPLDINGSLPKGKIGKDFNTAEAKELCRSACINLIATLKSEIQNLELVTKVVEMQGFLNTTDGFEDHAVVMDGASDLLIQIFGEKGNHARSVAGVSSLRKGIPVILRAVFEVE